MSVRVYMLLNVSDGKFAHVAETLHSQRGAVIADVIGGRLLQTYQARRTPLLSNVAQRIYFCYYLRNVLTRQKLIEIDCLNTSRLRSKDAN